MVVTTFWTNRLRREQRPSRNHQDIKERKVQRQYHKNYDTDAVVGPKRKRGWVLGVEVDPLGLGWRTSVARDEYRPMNGPRSLEERVDTTSGPS